MNYKPDEQTLLAYLYGELDEKEKGELDRYFQEHPESLREMEALATARDIIRTLEDKEVIAPPIFMDDRAPVRPLWESTYFRRVSGIAAAILLLMVVGRLMGTEIRYSNGELSVNLGKKHDAITPSTALASLTPEEVQAMINTSLERNNASMTNSLTDQQRKFDESIKKRMDLTSQKMSDIMKTAAQASEAQVRGFIGGLQDDNLRLMKDYLQLSNQEQKKYVENLLVDFSKYLQEQRNQDLDVFQTKINSMESNSNQFKQETEQILSSIISSNALPKKNTY